MSSKSTISQKLKIAEKSKFVFFIGFRHCASFMLFFTFSVFYFGQKPLKILSILSGYFLTKSTKSQKQKIWNLVFTCVLEHSASFCTKNLNWPILNERRGGGVYMSLTRKNRYNDKILMLLNLTKWFGKYYSFVGQINFLT